MATPAGHYQPHWEDVQQSASLGRLELPLAGGLATTLGKLAIPHWREVSTTLGRQAAHWPATQQSTSLGRLDLPLIGGLATALGKLIVPGFESLWGKALSTRKTGGCTLAQHQKTALGRVGGGCPLVGGLAARGSEASETQTLKTAYNIPNKVTPFSWKGERKVPNNDRRITSYNSVPPPFCSRQNQSCHQYQHIAVETD